MSTKHDMDCVNSCSCNYPVELVGALDEFPENSFVLSLVDYFDKKGYLTDKQMEALINLLELREAMESRYDIY